MAGELCKLCDTTNEGPCHATARLVVTFLADSVSGTALVNSPTIRKVRASTISLAMGTQPMFEWFPGAWKKGRTIQGECPCHCPNHERSRKVIRLA